MTQARRKTGLCLAFLLLMLPVVHSGLYQSSAFCEQTFILKGMVVNSGGKAVEGAEVFIYDSPNVRRSADFISAKTDKDGEYSVVLPEGKYWAVARFRKGGLRYGPLMPGDKHSGEPAEIEFSSGGHQMNFIVADLQETASMNKKKTGGDYIKIKGRIIDKNGLPVKMVYAIANKNKEFSAVPDYISTWTDDDGYYTLYLPRGEYYVGYASAFPPGKTYGFNREIVFTDSMTDSDIVIDNMETNKGKE